MDCLLEGVGKCEEVMKLEKIEKEVDFLVIATYGRWPRSMNGKRITQKCVYEIIKEESQSWSRRDWRRRRTKGDVNILRRLG